MTSKVDLLLRSPEAFGLARRAMAAMEAASVWPTPVNFEIWLHSCADPEGRLGQAVNKALATGEAFTEAVSDALAAEHLAKAHLSDQLRDAGAVLNEQMSSVSEAIAVAQRSQAAYGETLADASATIDDATEATALRDLVRDLSTATTEAHRVSTTLEQRLENSNLEVARLRQHLEQVRRDSMTDALTTLANRKAFDEQLEAACRAATTGKGALTLAVLDIDNFKRFNDTWGHQTGDQVLRYVASVIGRVAPAPRIAARYGGEEFAVICPGETVAAVEIALNGIRTEIGNRSLRRRSTNDELGAVTLSGGVTEWQIGDTPSSLLDRADAALYASKHNGRNRITNADRLDQAA